MPSKVLASEVIPDGLCNIHKAANKEEPNDWLPVFPYLQKQRDICSYISSLPIIHQKTAFEASNKHERLELSPSTNDESVKLLQQRSNVSYLDHQNQLGMNLISDQMRGGETSVLNNPGGESEHNVTRHSNNFVRDNINVCDVIVPCEKFGADLANFTTNFLDSNVCDRVKSDGIDSYLDEVLNIPESSDMKFRKDLEKLEYQAESAHINTSNTFLKFSAGCELLEALGPAFLKRCMSFDCETEKTEAGNIVEMPEGMSSSQMTFDTGSENLLDAVVGRVCHSGSDFKSEKSICKSVQQSLLTAEKIPEPSSQAKHIVNSASYSINQCFVVEEDTQNCSNSTGVCGGSAMSSKGFSSTCPSTCNEQLDKRSEPTKANKKRARPGENCRPRPRDRQLIQDRIKELRELVPNGSKVTFLWSS